MWALNHKSFLLNSKPDCPLVKITTYDTEASPSVLLKLSIRLRSSPKLFRLIFYKFSCQLGQILTSSFSCLKISKLSFCRHIYFVSLSCSCPVFLVWHRPRLQQRCMAACGWLSVDSPSPSGGKGPQEVSAPTCCSRQGQLWGRVRLLEPLPGESSNAPKDGDRTTSLGSLLPCLALLTGSKFLLRSHPNLSHFQ